jgi:hypothetical protein
MTVATQRARGRRARPAPARPPATDGYLDAADEGLSPGGYEREKARRCLVYRDQLGALGAIDYSALERWPYQPGPEEIDRFVAAGRARTPRSRGGA